jgi:hypothetical protein
MPDCRLSDHCCHDGWPGFIKHPFNAIRDAEEKAAAGASPEQMAHHDTL